MSDLIELQLSNLLSHLAAVQTHNNLKYLVVDETTEHLINSLIDKKTLLRNVTAVERIDKQRKSQPNIDAVYIIDPTRYSLSCLKTDFKVVPPRYKSMAIYVLPSPSVNQIIADFSQNSNPIYSKLIRFIKVFNFNFLPVDKHVFLSSFDSTQNPIPPTHKNMDENDPKFREKVKTEYETYSDKQLLNNYSLQIFYNPVFRGLVNFQVELVVNSLLNLCIVTNEYPIIRYYSPKVSLNNATVVSKIIATKLQERLDDYLRNNPNFNPNSNDSANGLGGGLTVERSILVVTDRTMDLVGCFLHEFNYESMVYDFLLKSEFNTKNFIIFYKSQSERGVDLKKLTKFNQRGNDKYYMKYRHLHISEAYDMLNKDVQKLIEDNPLLVNRMEAANTSDIMHILANSAEFDEERRLLFFHKQLIERLLSLNLELNLSEVSDLEQTIAANGFDINDQLVKAQGLTNSMVEHLHNLQKLDITHRVRIIVLYVLRKKDGILVSDLIKLFKFLGVQRERDLDQYIQLFKNLSILNNDVIKLAPSPNHHHAHNTKHKDKPRAIDYSEIDNTEYNTSRYKPAIGRIAKNLINNNTAELHEFPYANEANNTLFNEDDSPLSPGGASSSRYSAGSGGVGATSNSTTSLRNQKLKATWYTPSKSSTSHVKKQKLFFYIVGGITTAEIKAIYEVGEKLHKDIYLGSENILVPNETIFNLKNLNNDNPKELNPFVPFKLSKEAIDKAPEYLMENGFAKPGPPPGSVASVPGSMIPPHQQGKPLASGGASSLHKHTFTSGLHKSSGSKVEGGKEKEKKLKLSKFIKRKEK